MYESGQTGIAEIMNWSIVCDFYCPGAYYSNVPKERSIYTVYRGITQTLKKLICRLVLPKQPNTLP